MFETIHAGEPDAPPILTTRTPAHEEVIERLAAEWTADTKRLADQARAHIKQRFDGIQHHYNRSIAQRRRFLVARQLREKANP